mmetsp:Transcript_2124/g.5273  ORF Transcript_2124/g.5273 Transcript_2124/m.5273 type:complete len:214 (-) Transcript_2124:1477-2118(-)
MRLKPLERDRLARRRSPAALRPGAQALTEAAQGRRRRSCPPPRLPPRHAPRPPRPALELPRTARLQPQFALQLPSSPPLRVAPPPPPPQPPPPPPPRPTLRARRRWPSRRRRPPFARLWARSRRSLTRSGRSSSCVRVSPRHFERARMRTTAKPRRSGPRWPPCCPSSRTRFAWLISQRPSRARVHCSAVGLPRISAVRCAGGQWPRQHSASV